MEYSLGRRFAEADPLQEPVLVKQCPPLCPPCLLLRRWISAGAFYPFSRDHTAINTLSQELYRWPAVADAARTALGMRYSLLPYLYTAHYLAATRGGTVARPLLWVDPADATAR
jgi:alpha-glucosidase (family GH31 glycosyl hydrolase)